LDFRSDMYCLGITLYRMVTGGVPFADASAMAVMQKQLKEVAIPAQFKNSDVSTNCSGVIDKLLSKNREDRYESWSDLIGDMKAVLKGQKPRHAKNVASQPETEMAKDRPGKRKRTAQKSVGKKKRAPRAKGVSREDVERIANEMYGGGYMVKKLILYGVSALIPLLLVGGFFYLYNRKFKKTKQIEQLYRNAETIFRTETNSFDKAIDKFDEVRRLTDPGSAMYQKAEARIHELQIEKVLFSLKEKSAALIKRRRWRDAVRLYEDYSGEYSGETADQRKRQAAMIRKNNR
jgi:serine/threonine protein kinase